MSETQTAPRVPMGLIAAIVVTGQMAVTLYLPSLPTLERQLGATGAEVQATLGVYLLSFAVAQVFVGPLADRFGRRVVILAGLALFVAASALCAAAPSVAWLITARAGQGAASCAGIILARAIVRDLTSGAAAARAQAKLATAMAVAPAVSPLLGGQFEVWLNWRWGFAAIALTGAAAWWMVRRRLPETGRRSRGMRLIAGYGEAARSPVFLCSAFGVLSGSGIFYVFLAAGPTVFITDGGLSPDRYGLIALAWSGCYILGAQATVRLGGWATGERAMLAATTAATLACLAMAWLGRGGNPGALALTLPLAVCGLANGINVPNAVAVGMGALPTRIAGTASAAMGIAQMGFGAVVTWIVGQIYPPSALAMAALMAVIAVIGVLAYLPLVFGRARASEA